MHAEQASAGGSAAARIRSMEGLRGYAVALVFLVHFIDHYSRRHRNVEIVRSNVLDASGPVDALARYLWASHYGVDLFFLLSGFLIFRMVRRPDFSIGTFLLHRLARLYPAFGMALVIYAAYQAVFWGAAHDWTQLLLNLLLVPGIPEFGMVPIIVPSWSLTFEWLFYLIVPPLLLLARRLTGRLGTTEVVVIGLLVVAVAAPVGQHYARLVMFFAGGWLAAVTPAQAARWTATVPPALMLLMYLSVTFLFATTQNYYLFSGLYAVAATLLVAHCLYGRGAVTSAFEWTPLRALGNVSYSFYLLHGLVIVATVDHLQPVTAALPPVVHVPLLAAISFVLCILAARISYQLFERPYFERRRRADPGTTAAPRPLQA